MSDAMFDFQTDLRGLINHHSLEQDSGTPDFVLASYLVDCLKLWNTAVKDRDKARRKVLPNV